MARRLPSPPNLHPPRRRLPNYNTTHSRNARLSDEARQACLAIPRAIQWAEATVAAPGAPRDPKAIASEVAARIAAAGGTVDYVEVRGRRPSSGRLGRGGGSKEGAPRLLHTPCHPDLSHHLRPSSNLLPPSLAAAYDPLTSHTARRTLHTSHRTPHTSHRTPRTPHIASHCNSCATPSTSAR